MSVFDDWPAWVAFVTICAAYAMGYFMGRIDSTLAPRSKFEPPSTSAPVSVAGPGDLPDHPPTSSPVAGAGGETG